MGNVTPWPHHPLATTHQTGFDRHELARILDLYGRMVAAGEMARLCDGFPPRGRDLLGLSPRCRATRISHRKTPRLAAAPGHVGAGLRRRGDIEARGRTGEYPRPRRTQAYEAGRGLIAAGSCSDRKSAE